MKNPENMTKKELVRIVRTIRDWLWLMEDEEFDVRTIYGADLAKKLQKEQPDKKFLEFYYPDKEHDADIIDGVATVLRDAGLAPTGLMTLKAGYPDRTPEQRWKDDEIQFARLLEELRAVGIIEILKNAETSTARSAYSPWQDLLHSMDLSNERVDELFERARKRWDQAKKEI